MFSFFFCWRLLLMFGGIWQGWFQVGLRLRWFSGEGGFISCWLLFVGFLR
jgi:hypothetical protein